MLIKKFLNNWETAYINQSLFTEENLKESDDKEPQMLIS